MTPIIDEEFNILVPIQPRIPDEVYIPPEYKRERPTWTVKMSIFRDYKPDTEVSVSFHILQLSRNCLTSASKLIGRTQESPS